MAGNALGYVLAGAAALEQVILRPRRAIVALPANPADGVGPAPQPDPPIVADAVVSEHHTDDVVITDHPVEHGASISDHAFRQPAVLTLVYGWAAGSLQAIAQAGLVAAADPDFLQGLYARILKLVRERALCDVYTGKRVYTSMLVRSVSLETTKESEHSLQLRITMREILIARTQVITVPTDGVQADPKSTGNVIDQGAKQLKTPADPAIDAAIAKAKANPGTTVPVTP